MEDSIESVFLTSIVISVVLFIAVVLIAVYILFRRRAIQNGPGDQYRQGSCLGEEAVKSLQQKAAGLGLTVHVVAGSTIYAAIEDQMAVLNPEAIHIRMTLRKTSKDSSINAKTSWQQDAETLQRLANFYDKNIETVHSDSVGSTVIRPFYSRGRQARQTLYIGYDGNGRYVSLRPESANVTDPIDFPDTAHPRGKDGDARSTPDTQNNILVGDNSFQIIQIPSADSSDEEVVVRNIVVGEQNSQNILATFRTARDLVHFIQMAREGNQDFSEATMHMKVKVKSDRLSDDEVDDRLSTLVELLNDDNSETRRDLDTALHEFGVTFHSAMEGCILIKLVPWSTQWLYHFVNAFRNGEAQHVVAMLLLNEFGDGQGLQVDVQLRLSVKVHVTRRDFADKTDASTRGNNQHADDHIVVDKNITDGDKVSNTIENNTKTVGGNSRIADAKCAVVDKQSSESGSHGISVCLRKNTSANVPGSEIIGIAERAVRTTCSSRETSELFRGIHELDVRLEPLCSRTARFEESRWPEDERLYMKSLDTIREVMRGRVGLVESDTGVVGTCFLVGPSLVMTAFHVLKPLEENLQHAEGIVVTRVYFPDTDMRCSLKTEYFDRETDVALLRLNTEHVIKHQWNVHNISLGECQLGRSFFILGYKEKTTSSLEQQCERTVAEKPAMVLAPSVVNFQALMFGPGSSGSPGLSVKGNNVYYVAMLQGEIRAASGVTNYGIKLSHIFEKLKEVRPDLVSDLWFNETRNAKYFNADTDKEIRTVLMVCVVLSAKYIVLAKLCLGKQPKICRKKCRRIIPSLLRVYSEMAHISQELQPSEGRDL